MSQKKLQLHMAWKEKRRQQQLKAQYGIDRPDVVVVERKNVFVITLRVILHAAYIALRMRELCCGGVGNHWFSITDLSEYSGGIGKFVGTGYG